MKIYLMVLLVSCSFYTNAGEIKIGTLDELAKEMEKQESKKKPIKTGTIEELENKICKQLKDEYRNEPNKIPKDCK